MYFCDKYWILSKMDKYDKRHQRNLRKLDKELETIYTLWQKEASALVPTIKGFDPSREFDINRYPKTKKQLDALTKKYAETMRVTFESRIKSEWNLAQGKNDEVVKDYFGATARDMKTPSALMSRYLDRNEKALETFLSRKSADTGLTLSERVWDYAERYRTEIESGLELALRDGLSANETAKELKKYLRHPDKLFRRVRNKQTGKLKLSKPAKAFHPGTGVYRSSFKNARRLVATEVNIAYRTSDHLRWQSMDFVTGVEVKLSNNHTLNGRPFTDICDDLKGTYPKDFKFTGWHPLCRCYAVPALEDPDRFFARTFRGGGESPEGVTDVPDNFKAWAKNNADRISKAEARGKLPYFTEDNRRYLGDDFQNRSVSWKMDTHIPPIPHTGQKVLTVSPGEFKRAISTEKTRNKNGWMVDVHDDYTGLKCFLTGDGKSGVAVTKDGDIVSLFSSVSGDHRSEKLIFMAIENGGVKCDCYAGGLQNLYARFGAKAVGKTPFNRDYAPDDWKAIPDGDQRKQEYPVVAMIFPKKVTDGVSLWNKGAEIKLSKVRYFSDYEEMLRYRDSLL